MKDLSAREVKVHDLVGRTLAEIFKSHTDPLFQRATGVELGPFWAVRFASKAATEVYLAPIQRPGDVDLEKFKLLGRLEECDISYEVSPDLSIKLDLGCAVVEQSAMEELEGQLHLRAGWYKATFPDGTKINDLPGEPVVVVRTRWRTQGQDQYKQSASGLFVPRDNSFTPAGRLPHHYAHIGTVIASSPEAERAGLEVAAEVVFKQTHFAIWKKMSDSTMLGWVPVNEIIGMYEDDSPDPFGPDAPTLLT